MHLHFTILPLTDKIVNNFLSTFVFGAKILPTLRLDQNSEH